MRRNVFLLLLIASVFPQMLFCQIDYKGFPEWSLQKKDSTEYALYTPAHLQAGKKYPIVLFMHGCCGTDNHASLRNAVDPPARMWHQFGANKQTIPTYIISPATARGWKQHFAALKSVMDDLIANRQGDPERVYVCGFSMGGEGVYRIIQEYPGYFAAAIPMGMRFSGDSLKVKDIPLWMNQGETDFFSRPLRKQVAAIRSLNGYTTDTGSTWVTGVNPRYSNFKGLGHVVQWIAASTQDLTGWAYKKMNDGYKYPSVFFTPVDYPVKAESGKPVTLTVQANVSDTIRLVKVYINHVLHTSLMHVPWQFTFTPVAGDNLVEAMAYTNRNKSSTATTIVRVKMKPQFVNAVLPAAYAGNLYETKLHVKGNGEIEFYLVDSTSLPKGIDLYPDGMLKGICSVKGSYKISIIAKDVDGEKVSRTLNLVVRPKKPRTVLVTNASINSVNCRISKVVNGEALFFNGKDSSLSSNPEEINFSEPGNYQGLTFIRTDENEANKSADNFLHFTIDEDAIIYIAYEKIEKPVPSSIPVWLQSFKKENGQIVAQYRYFDVYSMPYKKGNISLPGADAKHNGVSSPYFVMIKKQ
ncbi:MAG: hypothetical protein ABI813_02280 [Bacteroidota bacterium]